MKTSMSEFVLIELANKLSRLPLVIAFEHMLLMGHGNIFFLVANSLEFPQAYLRNVQRAGLD